MEPSGASAAGSMPARARHIAVIGPGRCAAEEYADALEVGRLIAARGAVLVCGGLGGVMEAAARGAKEAGGHTVGILPGHERGAANPFIDLAVTTGLGEARNLVVVSTADAVIAVGGGYGTLSEIGLAAKIARPVVILHGWNIERRPAPGSAEAGRARDTAEADGADWGDGPDGADCAEQVCIHRASSPDQAVATAFSLL